jgi:NADPH-dependent 2,4-dienoyl-CoA reductase/sulfur reductase-like enzyme
MMWDVSNCDIAVIGAGPAGLAAATAAARAGLSVVVLDENLSPGGQIYRAVSATRAADKSVLGGDYWAGARLVDEFKLSGAVYISGATVWLVTREREVGYSIAGRARRLCANRIIIATGALERPFSIPGWTLPGVN